MMLETSQPGVFAAGDVRSGSVNSSGSPVSRHPRMQARPAPGLNCVRTQRSPNPRLAAGPSLGFHFQWGSLPSRFPPTSLSCPLG
jgi:hypothetical protein